MIFPIEEIISWKVVLNRISHLSCVQENIRSFYVNTLIFLEVEIYSKLDEPNIVEHAILC